MQTADLIAEARKVRSRILWSLAASLVGWVIIGLSSPTPQAAVLIMAAPSLALLWFTFTAAQSVYGGWLAAGMTIGALLLHREGAWWAIPALASFVVWRLTAAVSRGQRPEDVGRA